MENLVTQAIEGNEMAFNELVEQTYSELYWSSYVITNQDQLSKDAVQEAYIYAFANLVSLKNRDSFKPWIKKITYGKTIDLLRKNEHVPFIDLVDEDVIFEVEDLSKENDPSEHYNNNEKNRIINQVLDTLSSDQKACVIMFYFDEMSIKEISELLNVNENTVKSRLNYARKNIEKEVIRLNKEEGIKLYSNSAFALFIFLIPSLMERPVDIPKLPQTDTPKPKKNLKGLKNKLMKNPVLFSGIILAVVITPILIALNMNDHLKMHMKEATFEYGDKITLTKDMIFDTDEKDVEDITFISDTFESVDEIIEVGTYEFKIEYKNREYPFKIIVEDTNYPQIEIIKELKIGRFKELNINDYVTASDVVDGELEIEVQNTIDTTRVGNQTLAIKVSDKNGNTIEEKLEFAIVEESFDVLQQLWIVSEYGFDMDYLDQYTTMPMGIFYAFDNKLTKVENGLKVLEERSKATGRTLEEEFKFLQDHMNTLYDISFTPDDLYNSDEFSSIPRHLFILGSDGRLYELISGNIIIYLDEDQYSKQYNNYAEIQHRAYLGDAEIYSNGKKDLHLREYEPTIEILFYDETSKQLEITTKGSSYSSNVTITQGDAALKHLTEGQKKNAYQFAKDHAHALEKNYLDRFTLYTIPSEIDGIGRQFLFYNNIGNGDFYIELREGSDDLVIWYSLMI